MPTAHGVCKKPAGPDGPPGDFKTFVHSERGIMRKFLVTAGLLAAIAAPMQAQTPGEAVTSGQSSFYVSPYAGYVWFGDLFDFGNDVELSTDNGALFGVQAGVSFSPNIS